jgi:hypothetical protein
VTADDGGLRRERRSAAAALDALIGESSPSNEQVPPPTGDASSLRTPHDVGDSRRRSTRLLSVLFLLVGFTGVVTDAVAAAQLLANSGASALGVVWPVGGLALLVGAAMQSTFVDRLPRRLTLSVIAGVITAMLLVALALSSGRAPAIIPAILEWIAADQLNFLVPLLLWSVAGDMFAAGEAAVVFPRISRWWFVGQMAGLVVATVSPFVASASGVDLVMVLVLPIGACLAVALVVWRLPPVEANPTFAASGRLATAVSDTVRFVVDIRGFRLLWIVSLLTLGAGVAIEYSFLEAAASSFDDAGGVQAFYAGMSLLGFIGCFVIQTTRLGAMVQSRGVAASLLALPIGAVVASLLLLLHSFAGGLVFAAVGLLLWRLLRWSIDSTARQVAMATVPDQRRTRVAFLTDLAPWSVGLIVVSLPIGLGVVWSSAIPAPLTAAVLSIAAVAVGRGLSGAWEQSQLSYRLKRRSRAR